MPGPQPRSGVSTSASRGLDVLDRLADAAERFGVAVAAADLGARVPGCAPWSAYDLAVHLGNIHGWAATIVETGEPARHQADEPTARRPRAVSEWYAAKAEDLYEVLRCVDPARPCWTLTSDSGQAGFWRRRQLHETVVHTLDLATAAGRAPSAVTISPLLAEDGVDEVLRVLMTRMHDRGHRADLTAPLALVAADTARAWTLTPRPVPREDLPRQSQGGPGEGREAVGALPPLVWEGNDPQADQVSAAAADLYRVLWGRAPVTELEISGDVGRVRRFFASRLTP